MVIRRLLLHFSYGWFDYMPERNFSSVTTFVLINQVEFRTLGVGGVVVAASLVSNMVIRRLLLNFSYG